MMLSSGILVKYLAVCREGPLRELTDPGTPVADNLRENKDDDEARIAAEKERFYSPINDYDAGRRLNTNTP